MLRKEDASETVTHPIGANVFVSPGATIAAGVLLEAAVNSRLTIEPGACVGAGVIIQAVGGELVLESGALLGQGVLVLGCGVVGRYTCVGANCTLINPIIASSQVLPPRSRVRGAEVQAESLQSDQPGAEVHSSHPSDPLEPASLNGLGPSQGEAHPVDVATSDPEAVSTSEAVPTGDASPSSGMPGAAPVYGRSQVTQLVNTLFPHRNAVLSETEDA